MTEISDQLKAEVIAEINNCRANGLKFLETTDRVGSIFNGRIPKARDYARTLLKEINQQERLNKATKISRLPIKCESPSETIAAKEPIYINGSRVRLIVGFYDQHITGVDRIPISRPAQVALKWCLEYQPDELLIGGDFGDFKSLSKWEEDYPGHKEGDYFNRSIDFCNYNLDVMQSVTRNKKGKLVYTLGNHEAWLEKYTAKDPHARRGLYDIHTLLRLEDRKIDWYPVNGSYITGKARFKHGSNANKYHTGTVSGNSCGESVFYGHTHDIQCFTGVREIDLQPFVAQSCGCLCSLNPGFMMNKPNKWVHGFLIMFMRDDGTFTYYVPHIVNNSFIWNGKEYSA